MKLLQLIAFQVGEQKQELVAAGRQFFILVGGERGQFPLFALVGVIPEIAFTDGSEMGQEILELGPFQTGQAKQSAFIVLELVVF